MVERSAVPCLDLVAQPAICVLQGLVARAPEEKVAGACVIELVAIAHDGDRFPGQNSEIVDGFAVEL